MRDKYGVSQDSYCYKNSDVLVNKLNIENHDSLAEAELAFTAIRYSEYSSNITSINKFNLSHLQALNFQLFQDVYYWAGDIRAVDIAKGETRFCTCTRIDAEAQKQFSRIPLLLNINSQEQLIIELADIFCELNIIHPFREGNGRTQRFFFERDSERNLVRLRAS
jgi:cell filamentation protein